MSLLETEPARFQDYQATHELLARVLRRPPLRVFRGVDGADGLRDLLAEAAELLDMTLVLVGHVNASRYTTVAFYAREPDPSIQRGDTIPIGETYCRQEIVSGDTFALEDALASDVFREHPGFTKFGLRAYAGASLRLSDGTVFGTLCGVDGRARAIPAGAAEGLASIAARVSQEIDRRLLTLDPVSST